MGVRHLEYFIKYNVPGGFVEVAIIEECRKHQKTRGEKPTIVIDLQNMASILNRDVSEMLYGGRSGKYTEMLEDFFKLLSSVANLVFFADGPVFDTKYDTWIQRQDGKYSRYQKVFDLIHSKRPVVEVVKSLRNSVPLLASHNDILKMLAKTYGTLTVAVSVECDTEIARYASLNPSVLAILADDSDYLIFPGQWRYFSIREMDLKQLKTKEFNRSALRKYLCLDDSEMVILSTIAGNDFIMYDEIKKVHDNEFGYNSQASVKFPAIAKMIHSKVSKDSKEDIPYKLAYFLFPNNSESAANKIRKSLDLYNTNFVPIDHNVHTEETEEAKLLRFCRANSLNHVYGLLRGFPKNLALTYYDFKRDEWPTVGKVMDHIYERQIGIILKHIVVGRSQASLTREIYTKRSHNEGYKKFLVTPNFPDCEIPDLIELLDHESFPGLDNVRFELLKWSICDTLENVNLIEIPSSYLRNVLTLYLMVKEKFIRVKEADLILLTVLNVEQNKIPGDLVYPPVVDERAFKLVFLFYRTFSVIGRSIKTVGLRHLFDELKFDGVFFHEKYLEFMGSERDPASLLIDIDHYRIYKHL